MDAVAMLLNGPRAHGAFLLRSILSPPWSLRIQDEAPLTLVAMVHGDAWIIPDGDEGVLLHAGDIAIVRGPDPYTVANPRGTPPQVIIHPGQRCATPQGEKPTGMRDIGVRTWSNTANGSTVILTGTYQTPGETSRRLLAALPVLATVTNEALKSPLVVLLADEIARDEPGQEAVLDRLLDLLLIAALRAWFARAEAKAPGWYRAHSDPVVGRALALLHHDPARPWTIAALAAAAGVSRASLARRFTELVGEPPMAYLTGWRLALAADLLCEPLATVDGVAQQVGYTSAFALSAAFKRVRGISPRDHRARTSQR